MVLGIVSILIAVVLVSGCINNENVLYQYNLSAGESPSFIGAQNVTVPNGTKTVKIKCENLTKLNSGSNTSYVNIYVLNTVPVTVAVNGSNTDFIAQYNKSVVELKSINLANETNPITENFTFNNTDIKGILIVNVNAKGLIHVLTT
jgi:hypothetical protein